MTTNDNKSTGVEYRLLFAPADLEASNMGYYYNSSDAIAAFNKLVKAWSRRDYKSRIELQVGELHIQEQTTYKTVQLYQHL